MLELLIAMVIIINSERSTPLVPDIQLTQIAQIRADNLCRTGQWSHDGWLDSFKGVQYLYAGENLARGFDSLEEANKAFMQSPTHRANILNSHYQYVGVATSKCGVVVELFKGL